MIERLYVHNYRCLENFTLDLKGKGSALLIGKNGSGKSTVRQALGVLQKIGRGVTRPREWIEPGDFTRHQSEVPMRFDVDVVLAGDPISYTISFKLEDRPGDRLETVVLDERLSAAGVDVFSRAGSDITFAGHQTFSLNSTNAVLSTFGGVNTDRANAIPRFRSFLASMILAAPVPAQMTGFSEGETDQLEGDARNFAAWLHGLLTRTPAAYVDVEAYLHGVMPDFGFLARRPRAKSAGDLTISFNGPAPDAKLAIDFGRLSDGEKCFFLSAAVLGYAKHAGPVFCFWDEPDNHLSLPEVGHFIIHLRRISNQGGQFVATTHNPEAIRRFSAENTLVLTRNSHLEPTLIRPLSELTYSGDLINALIRDEVIG